MPYWQVIQLREDTPFCHFILIPHCSFFKKLLLQAAFFIALFFISFIVNIVNVKLR